MHRYANISGGEETLELNTLLWLPIDQKATSESQVLTVGSYQQLVTRNQGISSDQIVSNTAIPLLKTNQTADTSNRKLLISAI